MLAPHVRLVEEPQLKTDVPDFRVGDTVEVHQKLLDGAKERVQVFEGAVIARSSGGIRETMTVRKTVQGEGVERIFPVHSPRIAKIVVKKAGKVRRAKLYYLRDRVGKATKVKDDVKRQATIDANLKAAAIADAKAAQEAAARGSPRVSRAFAMPRTPSDDERGFAPRPWWRRWFGRRSERAAAAFLRKLGYRLVAANVADPAGEIDLIALDGQTVVVVEVRSTSSDDWERTAASVDLRKQRKITGAALRFLARRRLLEGVAVRFDVLVLCWPPTAREPVVRHFPHAFEATGRFQFHG